MAQRRRWERWRQSRQGPKEAPVADESASMTANSPEPNKSPAPLSAGCNWEQYDAEFDPWQIT
jgi:hypothetical protein